MNLETGVEVGGFGTEDGRRDLAVLVNRGRIVSRPYTKVQALIEAGGDPALAGEESVAHTCGLAEQVGGYHRRLGHGPSKAGGKKPGL